MSQECRFKTPDDRSVPVGGLLVARRFSPDIFRGEAPHEQLDSAAAQAKEHAAPRQRRASHASAQNLTEVSFPGSITPITEAYIFARAAGYLKRRYVDIGDRVSAGQLLAEIDAPDLDQQVTQAQAALSQAEGPTRPGRGYAAATDSDPGSCGRSRGSGTRC